MDSELAETLYARWYLDDVSERLTPEEKLGLVRKISELSLKDYLPGIKSIPLKDFPELKPFTKLKTFSGKQLFAVMTEIGLELGMPVQRTYAMLPARC
jgi:hypothetical protein